MPWKDPTSLFVIEAVVLALFAGIGGMLAYVLREMNDEKKPTVIRALVEGAASAFVGLLAMLACKALGLDWKWSGMIVGVFGWMGAEASIALLARLIRNKLGIDAKK